MTTTRERLIEILAKMERWETTADALLSSGLIPSWNPNMDEAPRGKKLLVSYINEAGNRRIVLARYYVEGSLDWPDSIEPGEGESEFAPEGWYEEGEADAYSENTQPVERDPTHWMRLPQPPAE